MERTGAARGAGGAVARDPNRFLAAVQIGVTVAGFFSAAYGGSTLAPDLAPYLETLGMRRGRRADDGARRADPGHRLPLAGARRAGAQAARPAEGRAARRWRWRRSLDRFATLMRPVIWLLSLSTNALVRLLGGDPHATSEQLSEEELRDLVSTHEDLDEEERAHPQRRLRRHRDQRQGGHASAHRRLLRRRPTAAWPRPPRWSGTCPTRATR